MVTMYVDGHALETWQDCIKDAIKNFDLSREDAQDKDDCTVRIKGATEKWPLKWFVYVHVC